MPTTIQIVNCEPMLAVLSAVSRYCDPSKHQSKPDPGVHDGNAVDVDDVVVAVVASGLLILLVADSMALDIVLDIIDDAVGDIMEETLPVIIELVGSRVTDIFCFHKCCFTRKEEEEERRRELKSKCNHYMYEHFAPSNRRLCKTLKSQPS